MTAGDLSAHSVLQTQTADQWVPGSEDSLSISEIIAKRFKQKIKVNMLSEADDIERLIIKAPETANHEQDFDGSQQVQLHSWILGSEMKKMSEWPEVVAGKIMEGGNVFS